MKTFSKNCREIMLLLPFNVPHKNTETNKPTFRACLHPQIKTLNIEHFNLHLGRDVGWIFGLSSDISCLAALLSLHLTLTLYIVYHLPSWGRSMYETFYTESTNNFVLF